MKQEKEDREKEKEERTEGKIEEETMEGGI